jgi:aspartate-semialdehyde dehydrogenase
MGSSKNVAILGATGAVGSQMLTCLEERDFPVGELRPLASARSAGTTVMFHGEPVRIQEATPDSFDGIDIVLGAASDAVAKALLPAAVAAGATVVDNSHAFRLDPDVPLVIPEINAQDVTWNHGIISNPNCATIIGLMAVWPLHQVAGLRRLVVSTYQAASGAGNPGIAELAEQTAAVAAGREVPQPKAFAYQLAYNLIPQIGGFSPDGYTSEEAKMGNEGRKIMHAPDLAVSCTCVRVPVMRSHSESIMAEFDRPITVARAQEALACASGVRLVDDPATCSYPMPLDTSDQDLVFVGRVREDTSAAPGTNSLLLWSCGDQIRKGAATNAVQIAELLLG